MSDDGPDHSARLDFLEMRLAHQDRMIADLNEVLTSQWSKIEALERQITRLREEFENSAQGNDGPEPPPPHY